MAGFFSLGGSSSSAAAGRPNSSSPSDQIPPPPPPHQPESGFFSWSYANKHDHDHHNNHPYTKPSTTSFELWQQQQQDLYHRHHHQDLYSSAAALGVGPTSTHAHGLSIVSDHHDASRSAFAMMRSSSAGAAAAAAGAGSSGGGGGGVSCQDCGNQAKKDCPHMRCRTCCKSRGLECQTHVKSTWVPAAKRRERQHQQQQHHSGVVHHHQHHHGGGDDHDRGDDEDDDHQILQISSNSKRQRDSLSNALTPRFPSSHHTTSGLEVGNFPAEVSSNAVFRCVRVSSVDSADDQYAYQTAVSIGGHLFKGILLNHGPENAANYSTSTIGGGGGGESSSGGGGGGVQPLDLIATASAAAATSLPFDPSAMYQSAVVQPINAYTIAGTQYFLPPRS